LAGRYDVAVCAFAKTRSQEAKGCAIVVVSVSEINDSNKLTRYVFKYFATKLYVVLVIVLLVDLSFL
jgi:hypothetical protein